MSLAEAALKKLGTPKDEKSKGAPSQAMKETLREAWEAVKEDNAEAFVEALDNAFTIRMNS